MNLLDSAQKYLSLGWVPIPLKERDKRPTIHWKVYQEKRPSAEKVKNWWTESPNANIGIVTGEISGIVAFDEDGPEAEEFVKKQGGFPVTPRSRTAQGFHNIFKCPDFKVANSSNKELLLDVRGEGGYIVVPPSVHPSGYQYEWVHGRSPFDVEPASLSPWMIQYLKDHLNGGKERLEIKAGPEDWEKARREIAKHQRIMNHWLNPNLEDRSGHDWRLACLCLEAGIEDPGMLYQILLNNPYGKAQHHPDTDRYIKDLIFRCKEKFGISNEPVGGNYSFPEEIISGVAGEFTNLFSKYMEPPRVFLFFGSLCCLGSIFAGKLILRSERPIQTRYYLLFLGESADDRKSTAMEIPVEFFKEFFPNKLHVCWGVGSAEGLQSKLNETPGGRLLLCVDEFKALINKCRIEGSVLLQCLNTLLEKNYYEGRTKTAILRVENACLSILAASTTATYENIWTPAFIDMGFPNRIFIVPGKGERKHPLPMKIPFEDKIRLAQKVASIISRVGEKMELDLTPEGKAEYDRWYFSLADDKTVHTKRLDTYALRFMPLLAVNDGKSDVDLETVKKTIALVEWQRKVRELLDPIDATNDIARMEEKIRRRLRQFPHTPGQLKHFAKVNKEGIWIFNMAIKNLSEGVSREIQFNSATKKWEAL